MAHTDTQIYTVTVSDEQGRSEEYELHAKTTLAAVAKVRNLLTKRATEAQLSEPSSKTPRHCAFWKCGRFVAHAALSTRIRYWDGQELDILLCPTCASKAVGATPRYDDDFLRAGPATL